MADPVPTVDFAQQVQRLQALLVKQREDVLRTEGALGFCRDVLEAIAAAKAKPSEEPK